MKSEIRSRLTQMLLTLSALFGAGLLYAGFVLLTGWGIPCVFHLVTGLSCPGCGVSRMFLALLRLDFAAAWQANPAILALLPLGLAVFADISVRYVRTGRRAPGKLSNAAIVFMIAVLLVFGVARNLF